MKILFSLFIYANCLNLYAITLKKVVDINNGWSFSFTSENNLLITEKNGLIKLFDNKNKTINNIRHNLTVSSLGQGSLMDIVSDNGIIYVSYSENDCWLHYFSCNWNDYR